MADIDAVIRKCVDDIYKVVRIQSLLCEEGGKGVDIGFFGGSHFSIRPQRVNRHSNRQSVSTTPSYDYLNSFSTLFLGSSVSEKCSVYAGFGRLTL